MVEKTLDVRVRAIMGAEMGKLQRHLESIGMVNARAGKAGREAGVDMVRGFKDAGREGQKLNGTIENSVKYLQLIKGVVSAFLLYKGFSFLTQQAAQFTRTLVDVQHEVGLIQTQLSETGKDFRPQLTQNIMRIAGETGVAMVTLAKAEYQVVSANIKVADSFNILELSAKAAVSGGLKDVDLAFNAALSQANVFGDTFADVYDKQFQVLKRGIFTYEQFATVVGTLSEAFASMGQDIETANASLAAISQVFTGGQLERGATGLRNAVLRISEAPEDFEALGIAVTDTEGNFRNFLEIAKDLKVVLEGMTQKQRANVIRNLFPDERERRGIGAFLGQLEKAEQFLVEQHFAVDGLNEAYETANDSLKTQADMFRNDLVPAMQPFVDMASVLLGVFNSMDDVLPGLNKNLLTTATVAAVIGGTMLMSGGKLSMSRTGQKGAIPMVGGGFMPGTGSNKIPTGFGLGVGAVVAGSSFMAGSQPGAAQPGDYLGAGIGGAAAGFMMGGPVGAAIGGTVTIIATALGDAMGDQSGPIAATFAEAFGAELEKRAGGIADAFEAALNAEISGVGVPAGAEEGTMVVSKRDWYSRTYGTDEQRQQLEQALRAGAAVEVSKGPFGTVGGVTFGKRETTRFEGEKDIDSLLHKELGGAGLAVGGQSDLDVRIILPKAQREKLLKDSIQGFSDWYSDLAKNADMHSAIYGMDKNAWIKSNVSLAARDMPGDLAGIHGKDTAVAAGVFAQALADGKVGIEKFDAAMSIFESQGKEAFLRFIGVLNDSSAEIEKTFDTIAIKFADLFTGDADLVANVFDHMGMEGQKLAEVFRRMAITMRAFEMLKVMQDFEMANPKIEKLKESTQTKLAETRAEVTRLDDLIAARKKSAMVSGAMTGGPLGAAASVAQATMELAPTVRRRDAFAQAATSLEERMTRLNEMPGSNLLASLGIDSTRAGEMLTDKLVEDLGLIKGHFSTEDFVQALLAEATPEAKKEKEIKPPEELQLASNSFADALFAASDLVREGFMDGMGRTADELEMLGEEFAELNRFVHQRALLEELKGIADFSGVGTEGIEGAMDILRQKMIDSGKALFDVLGDPASLAELIANMEFGDVNVDNSTQNSYIIRISEGVSGDPGNLARIADGLMAELNARVRRK